MLLNIPVKGASKMRLLLAEDEKALSKALVKIFEKNNCRQRTSNKCIF